MRQTQSNSISLAQTNKLICPPIIHGDGFLVTTDGQFVDEYSGMKDCHQKLRLNGLTLNGDIIAYKLTTKEVGSSGFCGWKPFLKFSRGLVTKA